jgi:hypothetical protein
LFPGGMTHTSAAIKITLTCNSNYPITAAATPSSPQYIPYNNATVGFEMPVYTSS